MWTNWRQGSTTSRLPRQLWWRLILMVMDYTCFFKLQLSPFWVLCANLCLAASKGYQGRVQDHHLVQTYPEAICCLCCQGWPSRGHIMPSRVQINPNIYAWKRNSELPAEIDPNCPFFMTQSRENTCKASVDVAGNLLTNRRVLESGIRLSQKI